MIEVAVVAGGCNSVLGIGPPGAAEDDDAGTSDATEADTAIDARPIDGMPAIDADSSPIGSAILVPSGAVARWSADQTIADSIGALDLQWPADDRDFGPGVDGSAFEFSQFSPSFPTAGVDGLPLGSADRTLELWVRMDEAVANDAFFAGYGQPGTGGGFYGLGATSGADLWWSQWNSGITGPTLSLGTWHHVAVTSVGNDAILYLDGASVGTGSPAIGTPADSEMFLGSLDPDRLLKGAVDEVRIYNRALAADEIAAIHASGMPPLEAAARRQP